MKIAAIVLVTLSTAAILPVNASTADEPAALSGAPMNVAKRLDRRAAEPPSAATELSGIPMREATVRLGQERKPKAVSTTAGPELSGVPLTKAKRP